MTTRAWVCAFVAGFLATQAQAQTTMRLSDVGWDPSISADGRFVAFTGGDGAVPGDNNGFADVFVRDRWTGTTELISVGPGGALGDNASEHPHITPDGRYVVFLTYATNLLPGVTVPLGCTLLRDRLNGTTEAVSLGSTGLLAPSPDCLPWISADGRFVTFDSPLALVPNDTNGNEDVFVRDRLLGTTERVSVSTGGFQGVAESWASSISDDGRFVFFSSAAAGLDANDYNGLGVDAYIRDRQLGTTVRVSSNAAGLGGDQLSWAHEITPDGRFIVFDSLATNLVPNDNNGAADIFVRDLQLGTLELVSLSSLGAQGNGDSHWAASISDDGRFVVFESYASNLVPNDNNGQPDLFVRDRLHGTTERLNVSTTGAESNGLTEGTWIPQITPDGRCVAFSSYGSNLSAGDTNGTVDVFVRDLNASGFTSLCEPGSGGVSACPCGNPPSGAGRGCDNSAATGGAALSASGIAYLASDSLVFTTEGERAAATSIVLQANASIPSGLAFGQGVRCVAGTTKRLYVKTASGGSIRAPDFAAGDAAVSLRSAQLGDLIQPGATRFYLVYYRDPIVLGGCSATATFNCTQTGSVAWWP